LWHLLQPELFVEILGDAGQALPKGELGEVTLSGGFNPWLPLLRYRTGDYARLVFHGKTPLLSGLSGRPPVRFRAASGEWLNNIEVTHVLAPFALAQWTLHQDAGGAITLRTGGGDPQALRATLVGLFGAGAQISVDTSASFDDKVRQYTSDLE